MQDGREQLVVLDQELLGEHVGALVLGEVQQQVRVLQLPLAGVVVAVGVRGHAIFRFVIHLAGGGG